MTKSPLEKEPMLSYEMKPIVGVGKGTYQVVSPNEDVEKCVYKSTTSKKQSSLIKTIRKLLPYAMLLQFILILYCVMAYYNFPGLIPLWLNKGHNTTIKTTDDNVQNISNAYDNDTMYETTETEIHIIVPKVTTPQPPPPGHITTIIIVPKVTTQQPPPPDHTTTIEMTSIISSTPRVMLVAEELVQVTSATTETTINDTRKDISSNNPLNIEPILKDIPTNTTEMIETETGETEMQDIFVDTYNGTDNIKIYNDFSKYDAVTEVDRVNVTEEEGTVLSGV